MNVTKKLGDWHSGDVVNTGVYASVTGTYTFEYEILSTSYSTAIAFTAGDELIFTNGLNEVALCTFRIKLPAAVITDDIHYVTTAHGEILFQYRNVL